MPKNQNLHDISRLQYGPGSLSTSEQVQLGCAQRMADATEKMAENYQKLHQDLAWYMQRYHAQQVEINQLKVKLIAQKGLVTRAKNRSK